MQAIHLVDRRGDQISMPIDESLFPFVSIIIPATRPDRLTWILHSLYDQRYGGDYEVIVVATFAQAFAEDWPLLPVQIEQPHAPGHARNLGAQWARGDVLIFLDDDCAVPADWITYNVLALQQDNVGAVGARIRGRSSAFFARCTDFACFGDFQHSRECDMPLATASMGIWHAVFEEAGGFDDTMVAGEEEDTDLCYRIQSLHYRTVYCPSISVLHDHQRNTFRKLMRHTYQQGLKRGLHTKIQYRHQSLRNRVLTIICFPPLFLLFLPIISLLTTIRIIALNIREQRSMLVYAPFIFCAKIVYNYGIFVHHIKRFRPQSSSEAV